MQKIIRTRTCVFAFAICLGNLCMFSRVLSQEVPEDKKSLLSISEFRPVPKLKVAATQLSHAKFPVIDVHTHFRFKTKGSVDELKSYLKIMDDNNIALSISLDATLGLEDEHLKFLSGADADRFGVFVHLDFQGAGEADQPETWACNQPEFGRLVAAQLKEAKQRGCLGLKFFKQFGLEFRDAQGKLSRIDDDRFDPIWQACGDLQMPVLIHTADPAAFFDPIDAQNERAEELLRHPEWSFADRRFPRKGELIAARNRVIAKFPRTVFIGAHVANNPENLAEVSEWLVAYPNLYVDISSRIGELGRQPFTSRAFFEKFGDRILFGTDGPWPAARLGYYWRFLESRDEYFPYSEKQPPPQGLWSIYGIELPDEILRKVYFENCLAVIPMLKEKFERTQQRWLEQQKNLQR
ncbi:MAG: amidohydrolase family protein [Pirellulaceae bacterium]